MKKIILIWAAVIVTGLTAQAQQMQNFFGVSWEVAFPGGDFVSKPSYLGAKLEYRRFLSDKLSLGATLSWNNYDEYVSRKTYENEDQTQAVTTDMERFVFNLPMTADVFYYFKGGTKFLPYIGVGLGAQYSDQEAYYNIYVSEEENWGFVARPQIGTFINWGATNPTKFILAAGYNYATNKNTAFNMDSQTNFWVSLGIGWGQ
jgi:outer membrane protein W